MCRAPRKRVFPYKRSRSERGHHFVFTVCSLCVAALICTLPENFLIRTINTGVIADSLKCAFGGWGVLSQTARRELIKIRRRRESKLCGARVAAIQLIRSLSCRLLQAVFCTKHYTGVCYVLSSEGGNNERAGVALFATKRAELIREIINDLFATLEAFIRWKLHSAITYLRHGFRVDFRLTMK